MARTTKLFEIITEGSRDKGKLFLITEASPVQGDRWAMRALFALMNVGAEMPGDDAGAGLLGLLAFVSSNPEGALLTLAKVKFEVAEPLLAELLTCVQLIPDKSRPDIVRRVLESDIEEITTFAALRVEVMKLHASVFPRAALSNSTGAAPTMTAPSTPAAPTSARRSAR